MKQTHIRIGVVQWHMEHMENLQAFFWKMESEVKVLAQAGADFVLFPEYFTLPLLTLFDEHREYRQHFYSTLTPEEIYGADAPPVPDVAHGMRQLADFSEPIIARCVAMAVKYKVNIVAGSMPIMEHDLLYNTALLCHRDGRLDRYHKIHLTPYEVDVMQLSPGHDPGIFDTDMGRMAILICYDVEFPELGRLCADAGCLLAFVPYSTESEHGHWRVRHSAQALAVYGECYVATAGCTGNMPEVPAIEFQYAQSGIYTPCDHGFPAGGILAEAPPNTQAFIYADLHPELLTRLRHHGTVRNSRDRRKEVYARQTVFSPINTVPKNFF
ncbi:MAG: carbon-nitrogen hydrolase family protein [Saprospiraceae bacterium]|nr:carbon-nitrogen hydrolase family protein [Saprospiraceae bacterium]